MVSFATTPVVHVSSQPKLRKKIKSIIRRGDGQADADCPDDPESVQFWVTRKAKYNEVASINQSQQMKLRGKASAAFIGGLSTKVAPAHVTALPAIGRGPAASTPGRDELLATSAALHNAPSGATPTSKTQSESSSKPGWCGATN